MKKIGFIAFAALLASGCAQTQLSPKGDAIFYALQADTMMNTWRYECAEVSSRANYTAQAARTDWWRRNGELVKGADFGLAYNMVTVTDTRQDTGARVAMALTWEVQERAQALVTEKLNKASDKEALCLEILGEYRQGDWDIKGSEEMRQALMSMKEDAKTSEDVLALRRGMIEKATGKRYGRSLYVVEKHAEQNGCSKDDISLVKGEWPFEVYNLNCPDTPLSLMRCEWGRCNFME